MQPDAGRSCGRYRDDLSAFVDHRLSARRWQRVGYHVAGCQRCRQEVDELRRVALTLSGNAGRVASAPGGLESRLQEIAGAHMHAPLYLSSHGGAALPSRRRALRVRTAQGGIVLVAALASVFVLALLLSPEPSPVRWAQLNDPGGRPTPAPAVTGMSLEPAAPGFVTTVRRAVGTTTVEAASRPSPSQAGHVGCGKLSHCFEQLAGLPLAAIADVGEGPDAAVSMVFTDGVRLLRVGWYPGLLEHDGGFGGAQQDEEGCAAAWQSGPGVWFAEAGGDPELLRAAISGLPEATPWESSFLDRLHGGFERLLGVN